jgi:competence protein ComEA
MPIETSQRYGFALLILILIVLSVVRDALTGIVFFRERTQAWTDSSSGPMVIELSGETDRKGIYYIPSRTPVRRFLEMAGEGMIEGMRTEDLDRILVSGMALDVRKMRSGQRKLTVSGMENALRLALDLPMSLNTVTMNDLMRIEGIGEKTATAIIETRKALQGFKRVDDLMEVPGIGEKKLQTFKPRFYIESRRSCSVPASPA